MQDTIRKKGTKKSQIWVSAVLYLVLGIVAISLILAAIIPVVNRMKDRNIFAQTKDLMFTLDETIRTVASEGPGSQRELAPFTVSAVYLFINDTSDNIIWTMETSAVIAEPNTQIQEGALNITLQDTKIKGRYIIKLLLPYNNIDLAISSSIANPISGKYSLIVKHAGFNPLVGPIIEFRVV